MGRKGELEKIIMYYVKWVFRLEFCTPSYIIRNELSMKKLRIGWGIRQRSMKKNYC